MNNKILIWKCNECGRINYSNPFRHHLMNICECDHAGLDLETYGCRIMGHIEVIEKIYPFFNEIATCLKEQDFHRYFIDLGMQIFISSEGVSFINSLEDEIIKDYINEKYG